MSDDCNKSAEVNGGTPFAEARGSAALLEVAVCLWCQPKLNWPRDRSYLDWTGQARCVICREHRTSTYWLVAPPGVELSPEAAKRVKLPPNDKLRHGAGNQP